MAPEYSNYANHRVAANQRRRLALIGLLSFIIGFVLRPARLFLKAENSAVAETGLATTPEVTPTNTTPLFVAPTNDDVATMFESYFATSNFSTQDMDTLNRLALTHNNDPEAMFAATKDAIAQRCTYVATHAASALEAQASSFLPTSEDGEELVIKGSFQGPTNAAPNTISSKALTFSYDKAWYNTFKNNLIETVCSNTVLNEARRVFLRFVELTNQGLSLAQTHLYMASEAVYKRADLKEYVTRDAMSAVSVAGPVKVDMTVAFDATKITGLTPEEQNDIWPTQFNLQAQGDAEIADDQTTFSFKVSGSSRPGM